MVENIPQGRQLPFMHVGLGPLEIAKGRGSDGTEQLNAGAGELELSALFQRIVAVRPTAIEFIGKSEKDTVNSTLVGNLPGKVDHARDVKFVVCQ